MKKIKLFLTFLIIFICLPSFSYSKTETVDYFKRNVDITKKPQRIISLTPATTEILYLLNLGDKIVGVTEDCNYPSQASGKEKIGKFGFINLEKIVSLKPDIIFATKDMGSRLDVLKSFNIPLIALDTPTINSVIENIKIVGSLTDREMSSKIISKKLEKRVENIIKLNINKTSPKVFYCVWNDPLITAGGNSFIGDLIKVAGGKNIAENITSPFANYSLESLIVNNPDYIIIPENTYKQLNLKKSPWNRLKAVKENKILVVNDDIYQRPAPRIINALEELHKFIMY